MSQQNRKINITQITIGLFFISFLIVVTDSSMSIVLAPIIDGFFEGSSLHYSLISTMVYLGNIVMIYPLTKLSDRIGRKNTLIISLGVMVLGTFALYFATEYWMILVLRFVLGLNSITGVLSAFVIDHFPENERGRPLSIYAVGLVVGYLIGSLLGDLIGSFFGSKHSFLIIGVFPILGILNVTINIKDAPKGEIKESQEELHVTMQDSLKFLKSNKGLIGTLILNFLNLVVLGGAGTYGFFMFFTHFKDSIPGTINAGLYLLPIQIVEMLMFIILGRVKNFDKVFKMLLGLMVVLIGFAISFAFGINDPLFFSICIAFFGINIASLMQSADAISHKLIPKEHKSNLASIYRFVGILGNILGPVIFGIITNIWVYLPGYFLIIILLIAELLYWKQISKAQPSMQIPAENVV